jgi:hypothetical protein
MQDARSRGRSFARHGEHSAPGSGLRSGPIASAAVLAVAVCTLVACGGSSDDDSRAAEQAALVAQGRQIFRFDTFGDEAQWTDTLRMHEVIAAAVDPTTALSVGLKVDAEALPAAVVQGIQNGSVDLHSPATTIALLKLDAVVGLKGTVESVGGRDVLTHVGVTCALCHSTVDDSFAPGIGKRLDGWPNRDLNPGAILALSPAFDAAAKAQLNAWGPGKFDPRRNIDGLSKPAVIPPAYGLAGINSVTFTGDGSELAYWNRYVAVTQMGGLGTFTEPRLGLSITHGNVDLVSSKLPALQAYQLSIAAPPPPAGSFDPWPRRAASRCSPAREVAPAATAARSSPMPTARCIRQPTRWPSPSRRATRRDRRPSAIARRRCKASGSTRRISTTARRRRSRRWSRPTTRAARSGSRRSSRPTWSST